MRKIFHRSLSLAMASFLSIGLLLILTTSVAAQSTAHTAALMPAHAKVNKAIPAIGSTVNTAPTTVTVFTLENMNPDPKKSNLFVYSPAGDLISQGNAKVSLNNPAEMTVTIKPDAQNVNGVYVVQWITVSAQDGDPDEGAFVFTVSTSVAVATPTAAPATHVTNTGTTSGTTNTNSASGAPIWVPIVVGILALVVGLGAGFGLGRRNTASASSSVAAMRRSIAASQEEQAGAEDTQTPAPRT